MGLAAGSATMLMKLVVSHLDGGDGLGAVQEAVEGQRDQEAKRQLAHGRGADLLVHQPSRCWAILLLLLRGATHKPLSQLCHEPCVVRLDELLDQLVGLGQAAKAGSHAAGDAPRLHADGHLHG